MDLFKLFGVTNGDRKKESKWGTLFDKINKLLPNRNGDEVKLITGYAGLLGRVAYADMDISTEEQKHILLILRNQMGVDPVIADTILALLLANKVELLTIEDHFYARLVNEVADREHKLKLLNGLFEVAAADKEINAKEDTSLFRIAENLNLSRADVVTLKRQYRDFLSVLK